jgi:uncharacterized protein YigA (DUF484 family)
MDRAEHLAPEEAAAEAVKAYLRMHKARIADDSELLALLLPERFGENPNVTDFQSAVIERLRAENAALKAERDGLRGASGEAQLAREAVRRLLLDLIAARRFEDVVTIATGAASALSADAVSLGIESAGAKWNVPGLCVLPPGLADRLIEREAAGALMKGGAHGPLFGGANTKLRSVAAFRLRIGPKTPPVLYAVGCVNETRFDDESELREIAYFVRALERAMRAWLDLPSN